MYYPYLRGKQNELLALQELLDDDRLSERIVPIIEPVRFNRTYVNTLQKFIEKKRDIIIIRNPECGSYEDDFDAVKQTAENADEKKQKIAQRLIEDYNKISASIAIKNAYICNKKWISGFQLDGDGDENNSDDFILIALNDEFYDFFEENDHKFEGVTKVINKKSDIGDLFTRKMISLEDGFNKKKRNADYGDEVELFSRSHLNYDSKGFDGFSDYSIVGETYEEEGFAPSNISIHIVFFDKKGVLMMHHFTSEATGIKDQAGKFAGAMEKAESWIEKEHIKRTLGLRKLTGKYAEEKYPGLGTIKRYTIMHHLELIGDYLEK